MGKDLKQLVPLLSLLIKPDGTHEVRQKRRLWLLSSLIPEAVGSGCSGWCSVCLDSTKGKLKRNERSN